MKARPRDARFGYVLHYRPGPARTRVALKEWRIIPPCPA
jgi:hypothetical protein